MAEAAELTLKLLKLGLSGASSRLALSMGKLLATLSVGLLLTVRIVAIAGPFEDSGAAYRRRRATKKRRRVGRLRRG
jgi:hypothetical protein